MNITYCEKCGTLIRSEQPGGPTLCEKCRSGGKASVRRPRIRDSDQIPRKKIDKFIRTGGKSEKA